MPGIFKYFFYNNKRGIQNANNTKQHSVCRSLSLFSPILLCFIKPEFAWKWDETDKELHDFFCIEFRSRKLWRNWKWLKLCKWKYFIPHQTKWNTNCTKIQANIASQSISFLFPMSMHWVFIRFSTLSTRPDGWALFLLQMKKSGA